MAFQQRLFGWEVVLTYQEEGDRIANGFNNSAVVAGATLFNE